MTTKEGESFQSFALTMLTYFHLLSRIDSDTEFVSGQSFLTKYILFGLFASDISTINYEKGKIMLKEKIVIREKIS